MNNKYELYNGDCLELMNDIPDKSVDMILCDLPYGTTRNKWDVVIPFEQLWKQYNRVIKDNGAIVLFGSEPFSSKLRISNLKMFKYDLVWVKEQGTDFLNANRKPMSIHEIVSVFYKKQPTYNKQYRDGKPYRAINGGNKSTDCYGKFKTGYFVSNGTKRNPTTVINCNRERGLHPTQKPVALLEYLIKTYTNDNETLLDNCMGSGSTGVACINTNRKFIGIELDKEYFKIAKKRIEECENTHKAGDTNV